MSISTQFLYNSSEENLLNTLKTLFVHASQIDCAIAFLTYKGWLSIKPFVAEWLLADDSRKLRLIVRKDELFPDQRAVDEIVQLKNVQLKWFPSESFHLKQWIFYNQTTAHILTGSSNFTQKGLVENIEANILSELSLESNELKKIQQNFESIWGFGELQGDEDMQLSNPLTLTFNKVKYNDMVKIDQLYKENKEFFDYRLSNVAISGQHLEQITANQAIFIFKGFDDKTLELIKHIKDNFGGE